MVKKVIKWRLPFKKIYILISVNKKLTKNLNIKIPYPTRMSQHSKSRRWVMKIKREYTVAIDTRSSVLTNTGSRKNTATAIKPTMQERGMYSGKGHHKLRTNSWGPERRGVRSVTLALQGTCGNSHVNQRKNRGKKINILASIRLSFLRESHFYHQNFGILKYCQNLSINLLVKIKLFIYLLILF